MSHDEQQEENFSLRDYFFPLTTAKTVHFIIIIGLIVFANMVFNGFVWDDNSYIIHNPDFQRLDFMGLIQENVFNATSQYRPIPALYFSLLYSLFKDASFFYHVSQIALHITSTILLFFLFKHFFAKKISFFLSLVFLIHPIQVESVSFIGAAGNVLFFLFGMIALLLSIHYTKSKIRLGILFGFLLLSFLTKETGFLFLFVLLLFVLLYQKRSFLLFFTGGVITSVLYFGIRFGIGEVYFGKGRFVAIGDLTLPQRILNIPAIIFYYLKTLFFPRDLASDQQWVVKRLDYQHFYFPLLMDLLFFLLIGILGIYLFKSNKKNFKLFLFFFLWFVVGLFMHSQIFSLDMTVADRWFYFPFAGLLGMFGVFFGVISNRLNTKFMYIFGAIIIVLLSYRTIMRNFDWKDDITLGTHDSKISENAYGLENNLSYAYIHSGNCNEAKIHAKKSIHIYPTSDSYINLGVSNFCLENYKQAKIAFMKALQFGDTYKVYDHLANLALVYGDSPMNRDFLKNVALKKYPKDTKLWFDLAILEYRTRNSENAKDAIRQAYVYDKSAQVTLLFETIMQNRPLGINVKFGR